MNKKELVLALCRQYPSIPQPLVSDMADIIFKMITDAMAEGRRVEIRNFGTFFVGTIGRRLLHNPTTGEVMEVPARRLPRFKPGRELRHKVDTNF
ncbi:MAG: HU family DNA-binding protein [Gammaproteobacteria bacterium WSBS_2016_MAG_OTU1]